MKEIGELRNNEDIVEMYMRSLEDPMLDEKKQKEYLQKIKEGDEEAREEFIEKNLRLVVKEASRYTGQGLELLDLIQEGNIGLLTAVDRFDLNYSNRFSTYATYWIRQSITRAIADKGSTIRKPVHYKEAIDSVRNMEKYLTTKNNEKPTREKLAKALKMDIKKLEEIILLDRKLTSLNAPVSPDKDESNHDVHEFGDFVDNENISQVELVENDEMAALVNSTMDKTLNEKEIRIIKLRFGFGNNSPKTLEEVGKEFGVTRERIRQIEAKALRKLRNSKNINILNDYNPNYKD